MSLLDGVTIQQIRCFLAVAKTLRFSEAAFLLNLSQSALTKKIASLEKQLDIQLFDRTTRQVTLTPAGKQLLAAANQLNDVATGIEQQIQATQQAQTVSLRVGMIAFGTHQPVFEHIAMFAAEHPRISLETIQRTTQPLVEQILAGELDAAFVSSMYTADSNEETFVQDPHFIAKSVAKDPYYLVCSHEHALATANQVTYADMDNVKLISPERGMDVYHRALIKAFADHGVQPHVFMRCGTISEVLNLVKQNRGVAILSAQVFEATPDLAMVPFVKPLIRDTQLITRATKRPSGAVTAFYRYF